MDTSTQARLFFETNERMAEAAAECIMAELEEDGFPVAHFETDEATQAQGEEVVRKMDTLIAMLEQASSACSSCAGGGSGQGQSQANDGVTAPGRETPVQERPFICWAHIFGRGSLHCPHNDIRIVAKVIDRLTGCIG